jgi:hypothetical protein
MATKKSAASQAVLVTTEHRGVFFGYLAPGEKPTKESVTLQNARNCVYWSAQEKGVFGLAATGPGKSCKVGPKVQQLTLLDITSVALCTPEAVEAWEKSPWA